MGLNKIRRSETNGLNVKYQNMVGYFGLGVAGETFAVLRQEILCSIDGVILSEGGLKCKVNS